MWFCDFYLPENRRMSLKQYKKAHNAHSKSESLYLITWHWPIQMFLIGEVHVFCRNKVPRGRGRKCSKNYHVCQCCIILCVPINVTAEFKDVWSVQTAVNYKNELKAHFEKKRGISFLTSFKLPII